MKVSKGRGSKDKNEAIVEDSIPRKSAGKRKAVGKVSESRNSSSSSKRRTAKDPNKPKRPASAFFVFLEEFRKVYKEENPNVKAVSAVGKAGGEKWKSLSSEEKAPYEAKAAKRKSDYQKLMNAYNKKQESVDENEEEDDEEEPAKSSKKPKVNGAKEDDDADSEEEEEEEDDDDDDDEDDD
ncbi:unnamed protein product [Linum tenue]|uniref:HMG box domain-containing protein n=1 Tax=Linum tenue TaxID=586396 RepID=A0AAV0K2E3_9ROSI|nr:unnamed protein product [Linum tenue]